MKHSVSLAVYQKKDLDWVNQKLKAIIGDKLFDCTLKIKPFHHQYEGFLHQLDEEHRSKTGLYDTEGTGKSLVMLLVALAYISWGNKVVMFTLPNLFPQMVKEVPKFFNHFPALPVEQPKFPEGKSHESPSFLLVSYSTLIIPRYWRRYKKDYDFMILDEASEIKNGLGRRFERVRTLVKYNKGIMLVTATPYHVDYSDCYSFIKLTYGCYKDYYAYVRQHGITNHFKAVTGWKNTGFIRHRLFEHGIRRTKEQLLDLPETLVSYRSLRLSDKQLTVYKEFSDFDFFESKKGEIFDASYAPTLKHQRLIESVSNPIKFEKGVTSIIMEDLEHVMRSVLSEGNKMVVFFVFAETAKRYKLDLSFEFNIACIFDDLSESEQFTNDPDTPFVFGTYKKMSRGFNFGFSNYLYLVEIDPSSGSVSQALNRCHRADSTESSTAYIPEIANTVYDKSLTKLKQRAVEMNQVIGTEGSFISKL